MDRLDEAFPVFKQATLKKLNFYAHRRVPIGYVKDMICREEFAETIGHSLYVAVHGHVYGEKESSLTQTVELPVPEGRWAMFLWAITPARWRPWLKRKLGIRLWRRMVGFEQYRTYPRAIPAPSFLGGGDTGVIFIPIPEHESSARWIA